jgi:hypothetical protein
LLSVCRRAHDSHTFFASPLFRLWHLDVADCVRCLVHVEVIVIIAVQECARQIQNESTLQPAWGPRSHPALVFWVPKLNTSILNDWQPDITWYNLMIDKSCLVEVGIYRLSACALRIPHDFIFINPPSLEVATWPSSTCRHIQIWEATSKIKECIEVPAKILKKYEQVTKKRNNVTCFNCSLCLSTQP